MTNEQGQTTCRSVRPSAPYDFPASRDKEVLTSIAQLAQRGLRSSDLDSLRMSSGGKPMWQVERRAVIQQLSKRVVRGVILATRFSRVYWRGAYEPSHPDCRSKDDIRGVGDPGGECSRCPMSEWESAVRQDGTRGRGQACRRYLLLLFLRSRAHWPEIVVAPPTSLRNIEQYLQDVGDDLHSVLTRLELVQTESAQGYAYCQIVVSEDCRLDDSAAHVMNKYQRLLGDSFRRMVWLG